MFLGVYPKPFLDRVTPSVNDLLAARPRTPDAGVPHTGQGRPIIYAVPADQNVDGGPQVRTGVQTAGPSASHRRLGRR